MEEPLFDDLVSFESNRLSHILRDIWSRLRDSECKNSELENLLRDANGRLVALESVQGQNEDLAERIAALEGLVSGNTDAIKGLEGRTSSLEGVDLQELSARVGTLEEKIGALTRELQELESTSASAVDNDALRALQDRIDRNEEALSALSFKLKNLTLDELVEEKAHTDHLALEDDTGHVLHYDRTLSASERSNRAIADRGERTYSQVGGMPADRSASRLSGGEGEGGEAFVANRAGAARGDASGEITPRNVAELHHRVVRQNQTHTSRLEDMHSKHTELMHGYKGLNHLVNQQGAMLEELLKVGSEAQGMDDKVDRDEFNAAWKDLNGKVRQLADVSNRNVNVLGRMCNGKADAEDLMLLQAELEALLSDDSSQLAAGKIHFRCLSCDKFRPSMNGAATHAFRSASALSMRTGERPSSRPATLFGTDSKIYRGAPPRPETYTYGEAYDLLDGGGRTAGYGRPARPASAPPYDPRAPPRGARRAGGPRSGRITPRG